METLDHQNLVLNSQAEELALLRSKIRQFEHVMNGLKQSAGMFNLLIAIIVECTTIVNIDFMIQDRKWSSTHVDMSTDWNAINSAATLPFEYPLYVRLNIAFVRQCFVI
jgi:hypothetical protein